MTTAVLSFFADGFVPLPWWGYVFVTLALTHVTIAGVTIYLHRHQAHRGFHREDSCTMGASKGVAHGEPKT